MNWHAILLIFGLATSVGILLYLPFFLWFRWHRPKSTNGATTSLRVTKLGLCLYSAVALILFAGLALGHIAPQSWFGSQVRTLFGGLGYMTVICTLASVIERALLKRGFVFSYRTVSSPKPDTLIADKSKNEAGET